MKGIYLITNPDGGVYVGQSTDLKSRIRKHKGALRSYGCFEHIVSVITELPSDVSQDVLDEYERIYINQYKECGVLVFNLMGGGVKTYEHAQSSKEKFSSWQTGRKLSQEHKDNIGQSGKGRTHSEETKQKMRQWNLGKKMSEESKKKMREAKLKLFSKS